MKNANTLPKETRFFIRKLIEASLEQKKVIMLHAIHSKHPDIADAVERYQEIYDTLETWDEWEEKLED